MCFARVHLTFAHIMVAEIGFADETLLSLTLKIAVLDNHSEVVSLK